MNLKYYLRGLGLGIIMTAVIMGITVSGRKNSLTDEEIVERAKDLGMIDDAELSVYLEEAKAETEERVRNEIAAENAAMEMERLARSESGGSAEAESSGREPEGESNAKEDETSSGNGSFQENGILSENESSQENGTRMFPEDSREEMPEGMQAAAAGDSRDNNNKDRDERDTGTAAEDGLSEPVSFIVKTGESPYSIGQRLEEEGLLPQDARFDRFMVDNGYDTKIVAAEYEIPAGADMETIALIITKQRQ